jgi:hypothetical protein
MAIEQCTAEWSMGSSGNKDRSKKILIIKWKLKQNLPKPLGHSKSKDKRKEFTFKKVKRFQISNLLKQLKLLEKQEKAKSQISRWK